MIGGLDIYIRNSIMYNKTECNEYVIVCGDDDKHQPVERSGTPVKEYHISLYRSLNPKNDLKALWQAVKIIRKEKPDVIHCHSARGGHHRANGGVDNRCHNILYASCLLVSMYSIESKTVGVSDD